MEDKSHWQEVVNNATVVRMTPLPMKFRRRLAMRRRPRRASLVII